MNIFRELIQSFHKLLRALADTEADSLIDSSSVNEDNALTNTNPTLNSSTVGALRQLGLIDGNDVTGNLSV